MRRLWRQLRRRRELPRIASYCATCKRIYRAYGYLVMRLGPPTRTHVGRMCLEPPHLQVPDDHNTCATCCLQECRVVAAHLVESRPEWRGRYDVRGLRIEIREPANTLPPESALTYLLNRAQRVKSYWLAKRR